MTLVVIRPAPSCTELVEMFNHAGISAIAAPWLSFQAGAQLAALSTKLAALPAGSIVVAVSPRAVEYSCSIIEPSAWRADLHYIAVGTQTAARWLALGNVSAATPNEQCSEGVLAMPMLQQPSGIELLILRGDGGRTLLADKLTQQGAKVCYFETYQRCWDTKTAQQHSKLWRKKAVKNILVTSGEQLTLLWQSLDAATKQWITQCALFVPSERLRILATSLGFNTVFNVNSADNHALFDAVYQTQNSGTQHDGKK